MRIVVSSGHGKYVRGAAGPAPWGLDEVDEARKVVEQVATILRASGVDTTTFHDDVSKSQSENLDRIVNFHNSKNRDLDVSVHFNAYQTTTTKPMGTEVLFVTQEELADTVADAICDASGLVNRGPKYRSDLAFLNGTSEPSILIETAFCDAKPDCDIYRDKFDLICSAIAESISGEEVQPGLPPVPPVAQRRVLQKGMKGTDVFSLQESLGLPADGHFGEITDTQVRAFQAAVSGIDVDGVVGETTWGHVDALDKRVAAGRTGLTAGQQREIIALAHESPLMKYYWPGRGVAPVGYIPGMALTFAITLRSLKLEEPGAQIMAQAEVGNEDIDALAWYRPEFLEYGMSNDEPGADTLRHLFTLMIGLGMRESSGWCWEGRDLSADNVQADTAEAGLFQTSWNIATASPTLPPLLIEYWNDPNGFLEEFSQDIAPSANNLSCYGSGDGARYQWLARFAPAFAALTTAIGLRTRRQHWGPINRKEAAVNPEADELLTEVQALIEAVA
jgi:peptidoglycan hydrolase-like protein with peptidoglycan-binding domain